MLDAGHINAARQIGRHGYRDATMILMAYRHGLRISELVSLRWTQVNLKGALRIPKQKARINLQRKLKAIFRAKKGRPIKEIVEEINPILRGWVNYFRIGNSSKCFKKIEDWVQKKIRRHLYKTQQRKGFGWKRWNRQELYRNTGIYHDYRIKYVPC